MATETTFNRDTEERIRMIGARITQKDTVSFTRCSCNLYNSVRHADVSRLSPGLCASVVIFIIFTVILPSRLSAQLDLEQEVLIIPDTHDAEPYRWKKSWNIRDYDLRLEHGKVVAGNDSQFAFSIKTKPAKAINDMNVFITDKKLSMFKHVRPDFIDGKYRFILNAPSKGKYRFEFVFKSDEDGWINLSKTISVKEGLKQDHLAGGEEGGIYSVHVKLFPEKVYAGHVVTLLFEISYDGMLVKYPEKISGVDILLASWDESQKEFICAGSRQNVNGQIVASIVFVKPGRHRIFAEFKHNGAVREFERDIYILEEPPRREHGISYGDRNPYD